jgi:hypothetical protein
MNHWYETNFSSLSATLNKLERFTLQTFFPANAIFESVTKAYPCVLTGFFGNIQNNFFFFVPYEWSK